MFSTLRSRLWLSYALVIVSALFLTAFLLALYLLRSPLLYRATLQELGVAKDTILTSQTKLPTLTGQALVKALETFDETLGFRVILIGENRVILGDSRAETEAGIIPPRQLRLLQSTFLLRDEAGKGWLYTAQSLPNSRTLLVLTPRTRITLIAILRNELFSPFVYAGALALLLSLFVAFGLARWIGNPLQALIAASKRVPEAKPLKPGGPREIQDLTKAFNDMAGRVNATQKAHREFVANVSHELKTPITSIQGFAQALRDGTAETPEARKQAANIIQEEAERMHRMVLDLLDLARIDSGSMVLANAPVELPALLRDICEKFNPQAEEAGVTIRQEINEAAPIQGDGDRLAQAFSNLIDNAIKYTPRSREIRIRLIQSKDETQIEVEDDGIGMPAEAIPRIFDRFYQIDPSRPGGQKHGAGLGLSIVKEIITAHGGKISVQSNPGKGSTFTISLPARGPGIESLQQKKQPLPDSRSR